MKLEDLTSIFRQLGASSPETWAHSEIHEGIPQLARLLFLKGAWDCIASDEDLSWIDSLVSNVPPNSTAPYSGAAHSIRRMIDAGVAKSDIAAVVRGTQAEFLFNLCYMINDAEVVAGNDGYVNWGLVEFDDDDKPGRSIGGLHESVLGTDPTGREARPKPNG